jgi:hypothetical protein
MLSQPSTSAIVNQNETGVAPTNFSASGVVLPITDLIRGTGGAGGIVLTLTRAIYPTNNPAGPLFLGQVYYAMKVDPGVGVVQFVDPSGALFNGQPSYDLVDQWQYAIFMWNGTTWDAIGN